MAYTWTGISFPCPVFFSDFLSSHSSLLYLCLDMTMSANEKEASVELAEKKVEGKEGHEEEGGEKEEKLTLMTTSVDQISFVLKYFPFKDLEMIGCVLKSLFHVRLISLSLRIENEHFHQLATWSFSSSSSYSSSSSSDFRVEWGKETQSWGTVDIIYETPEDNSNSNSIGNKKFKIEQKVQSETKVAVKEVEDNVCPHGNHSNKSAGLYRLNITPFQTIPLHHHQFMQETELSLTNGLLCQGQPLEYGTVLEWGNKPHIYHNPTSSTHSLLCIDSPKFIPEDEREISTSVLEEDLVRAREPSFLSSASSFQTLIERTQLSSRNKTTTQTPSTVTTFSPSLSSPSSSSSSSSSYGNFSFPGAFPNQTVHFTLNPAQFCVADSVLVLCFSPETTKLLFVRHTKRGWELPGGKVEAGESAEQAAVRETSEEAGISLAPDALLPIAQYMLSEPSSSSTSLSWLAPVPKFVPSFSTPALCNSSQSPHQTKSTSHHFKTIFATLLEHEPTTSASLTRETNKVNMIPVTWDTFRDRVPRAVTYPGCVHPRSILLQDNVLALAHRLAMFAVRKLAK